MLPKLTRIFSRTNQIPLEQVAPKSSLKESDTITRGVVHIVVWNDGNGVLKASAFYRHSHAQLFFLKIQNETGANMLSLLTMKIEQDA